MANQEARPRTPDGPGLERTITLVDAVVAIAMTLLILPLVEASGEVDLRNLPGFYAEQRDLLLSFVISFLVIFAFWSAHGSIYRQLRAAGVDDAPWLGLMNMLWLLTIAFLPFPTALLGRDLDTASAVLYVGTMLVLSALTSGLAVVASRAAGDARPNLAWLTTGVFALCTAAAFVNADLALYLLLLLVPVRVIEGRVRQRRATG